MTYTTKKQNNLLFITNGEQNYPVSACDVLEKIRERVLPYREVKLMYEVRTKRDEFIYLDSMPGYQQGHFHGCIDGYQKSLSEKGFGESDLESFGKYVIHRMNKSDVFSKSWTVYELVKTWKEIRAIGLIEEGLKVELEMELNWYGSPFGSGKIQSQPSDRPKLTDGKVTVIRIL